MKLKIILQIWIMSKYALFGTVLQCLLYSFMFADNGYTQNKSIEDIYVSIQLENVQLKTIFSDIERKTDFSFAFHNEQIQNQILSINGKKKSLAELLRFISKETHLCFKRINENIYVSRKKIWDVAVEESFKVEESQQILVKGTVISSEDNEPLPGVSIIIKGTVTGTTTDIEGKYALSVPNSDAVMSVSYVGFKTQEITINNQSQIDITMEPDLESLEEVVVVGYGTVEKRDITGAVASFDEKALDRQPANNITELMRSALPGLNVGISTNAEGSSSLQVRGPTSLGASNSPLIVVDDVIFQGDISSINPADVESLNVLKDASAAAVYGSRAAAGVIIITTKKGSKGKPTINIKSSVGLAHAGVIEEVYGPEEFLDYKRDIFDRFDADNPLGYYHNPEELPNGVTLDDWLDYDGLSGTATAPEDIWLGRLQLQQEEIDNYKAGNTLDWKDILFQTGLRTNNTISLSGRSDKFSYYGSLGYVQNEGITLYQKYQALRGRLNLEAEVNKFLSVGMNMQASTQEQPTNLPNIVNIYQSNSPYGSLYYDDGSFKHQPHDDGLASNPYLWEYQDNYYKQREVFSNIYAKVNLPLGFSYRVNWSNRLFMNQDYRFRPVIATLGTGGDTGSRSDSFNHRWMVDNIFNWKKTIANRHDIDFTFLYNVEQGQTWASNQSNSAFTPNDKLSYHNLAIGSNPQISSNDTRYTADAMMGRLNYGFLDRYYLTLTLRRDGYSAFGQDNPRAFFPAVSLAWRLSDELFLNGSNLIDNLKLRLSWGKNGNREIGIYSALSQLSPTSYIYDQSTVFGIRASALANENLQWESTASYNFGLDFGIFNSRISGSMDAYFSTTNDLLLRRSLPIITGYNSVYANLGEVENKGFELALNTVNIDNGGFSWKSTLSFWMNRNKIKHLYGDMVDVLDDEGNVIGQREEDDIQNDWYIGHAVDEIFDYKIIGIWQLGEEAEATEFGREPGDVKILDVNNDGILNTDDKVFQGNTVPQYRLSLRNDLYYKNFDFTIFINSFLKYKGANNEHFNYRIGQERLNKIKTPYWTPENPTNEWTRIFSTNSSPGTNWWESKSFVRIQNVTIGYTFPERFIQKVKIQKLRVYANMQNLPAFSNWQYRWDVETSQPTPLIYTLGVDLSF